MNVHSEWPPALLQEAQAREQEGNVTALRGGAHDDGRTSHRLPPPSCLRGSDIRALENSARDGSPTKLRDHLEFLRSTVPCLRDRRESEAKQLEKLRLPYLEQEYQMMIADRQMPAVSGDQFGYGQGADRDSKEEFVGSRSATTEALRRGQLSLTSRGRSQVNAVSNSGQKPSRLGGLFGVAIGDVSRSRGLAPGKKRMAPKLDGPSSLVDEKGRPIRQPTPAAMMNGGRDPLSRRVAKTTTGSLNGASHDDSRGQRRDPFPRRLDGLPHDLPQQGVTDWDYDCRESGDKSLHNSGYVTKATIKDLISKERHTHTRGGDNHRHRRVSLPSRKRDSPDTNDAGVGHVDPKRPRPHSSTVLTRRKERNSTLKKEVIDLMESEDEQAESPDVVADVPLRDRDVALRDRGLQMVEWEDPVPAGCRTRSSAGTRRGMSPSSMHMDADLEGLRYKYPPDQMVGAVEVTGHDLLTLRPMEFVNDTIMDYYSKKIADNYRQWFEKGDTDVKLHWFNSFFYKKLTEKCQGTTGDRVTTDMYKKVCKWTKNVDVFAQDFLLIPIHDTAHWSLAIVCHPGNLRYEVMEKHKEAEINKRHQRGGQASTSRGADVNDLEPIPCILHLDPIANGGHETQTIGNALNQWLRMEWQNDEKIGKQVKEEGWKTEQCMAMRDSQDYQQTMGVKRNLIDDMSSVKCHRVNKIPHQDNYYDCGLYTLTYMEFFAYRTPTSILRGCPSEHDRDQELVLLRDNDNAHKHDRNFLRKFWFNQRNGSNLRTTLMIKLLQLMIDKAIADGNNADLGKQMSNAHRYIEEFVGHRSAEYHDPVEIFKNPDLALLPKKRPRQSKLEMHAREETPEEAARRGTRTRKRITQLNDSDDEIEAGFVDALDPDVAKHTFMYGRAVGERDEDFKPEEEGDTLDDAGENRDDPISEDESLQRPKRNTRSRPQASQQQAQAHHPPLPHAQQQQRCGTSRQRRAGAPRGSHDTDGVGTESTDGAPTGAIAAEVQSPGVQLQGQRSSWHGSGGDRDAQGEQSPMRCARGGGQHTAGPSIKDSSRRIVGFSPSPSSPVMMHSGEAQPSVDCQDPGHLPADSAIYHDAGHEGDVMALSGGQDSAEGELANSSQP